VVRGVTWTALSAAIAEWHYRKAAGGAPAWCVATGVPLLASSLGTVLTRNLGSVCFGAAVIAAVQLVQLGLRALRSLTAARAEAPLLLQLVVKCALCCVGCLDRTVRVVSHYALVYVAVRGDSFCKAARATFGLVTQHPLQVAVNRVVQRLLALLVGLTAPLACALVAYALPNGVTPFRPPTPRDSAVTRALLGANASSALGADVLIHTVRNALVETERVGQVLGTPLTQPWSGSSLQRQLANAVRVMRERAELGLDRAVAFVELGGFDTHGGGAEVVNAKFQEVDAAIARLIAELDAAGLRDRVVLTTASEFGRTYSFNGRGTDHAWGGNHVLVGGPVHGGRLWGRYPHDAVQPDDRNIGRGRFTRRCRGTACGRPSPAGWASPAPRRSAAWCPTRTGSTRTRS